MAYSHSWLEDPSAIKALFVEIQRYNVLTSTTETLYLSTAPYISQNSAVVFEPILAKGSGISENISLDGSISMSFGDVIVHNHNGEFDSWLDHTKYIWMNRSVNIYLGDPFWDVTSISQFKNDFLLVYSGLIADIDSKDINSLSFKVRDKLEMLNAPVTENKLGTYGTWAGGQANQDTIKPLVFGEVHNIEPLLVDPSTLQYMFNDGLSEKVIEIRDNGVPIYTAGTTLTTGATIDLTNGMFTLAHPAVGTITASIQGVKKSANMSTGSISSSYTNSIANQIAIISMLYGKVGLTNLTADDIDWSNFSAFDGSNTQKVGIYISDRDNVLSVCRSLADSIGAQVYFNRLGKLQLIRLGSGFGSTLSTITDQDIIEHTLQVSQKLQVQAAIKIAYCKNWTIQEGLLTGIPEYHKKLFATEWLTKTSIDSSTKTNYKLQSDPEAKETMLLVGSEASNEAARLVSLYSTPRTVYRFTGTSKLFRLQLGQSVTLLHNRFNLYNGGAGSLGQVVSLSTNWLDNTISVEVLI